MAFLKEVSILTAFTEYVFSCNLYARTTTGLLRSVTIPFRALLFSGNLAGNSLKCVVWEILHTFRGNGGK